MYRTASIVPLLLQYKCLATCNTKGAIVVHIKPDIRAERSAKLLYNGLVEVLKTKEFNKVTVSDISAASTVGRATFYRNFDEIPDLLYWKCSGDFKLMLTEFTESRPELKEEDELLLYVLRFWMSGNHLKILEILMDIGRLDIIYNSFVDNADILMDYVRARGVQMSTDDYTYFISVRAGFFVGVIRAWIVGGKKETPEQVSEIVRRQHDDVVNAKLMI